MPDLLLASWLTLSTCFASDVKAYCCPSACAVKKSSHWYQANEVLRGCMRGLGCSSVEGATVYMKCGC